MKQFILATAVALTSLTSVAQVQLPADIEASLGQTKISGGVRIAGMDIQTLRDSLKSVQTRAVFHLDANNQIELTPSSSTRDRAATKPGEFVGSGGGTMDEDVIDLTEPQDSDTSFRVIGIDKPSVPKCPEAFMPGNDFRPCYQAVFYAVAPSGSQPGFNTWISGYQTSFMPVTRIGHGYFDIEGKVASFVLPQTEAVVLEVRILQKTSSNNKIKENEDLVYTTYVSFLRIQKKMQNIFPVRKVSFKSFGQVKFEQEVSILRFHPSPTVINREPEVLEWYSLDSWYAKFVRADGGPSDISETPVVETFYLSPGKYKATVRRSTGTLVRDFEVK